MDKHLLGLQACDLRCHASYAGLVLRRHPDIAPVAPHIDGAVHGLHGRMGEEGQLVHRFDLPAGTLYGRLGIAVVPRHDAARVQLAQEFLLERPGAETRIFLFLPDRLEGIPSLPRPIDRICQDGHPGRNRHDRADAGHGRYFIPVGRGKSRHRRPVAGRSRHRACPAQRNRCRTSPCRSPCLPCRAGASPFRCTGTGFPS